MIIMQQWGRGRVDYLWNSHYPLECLFIFPCSTVTVNGQVPQLYSAKGMEMRNSEPLGVRLSSVHQPRHCKEGQIIFPHLSRFLAESYLSTPNKRQINRRGENYICIYLQELHKNRRFRRQPDNWCLNTLLS